MFYINSHEVYNTTKHILAEGCVNDVEYVVMTYGTHPCGYVKLDGTTLSSLDDYNDFPIYCHGGATFLGSLPGKIGTYIGWDYAHFEDYSMFAKNGHKWTTEELLEEAIIVAYQVGGYYE